MLISYVKFTMISHPMENKVMFQFQFVANKFF